MRRAAAAALAAVMTGGATVQRLRQDREAIGDAADVQALGGFLDQQLVAARLRRRLENAVRIVRQSFIRSEEADVSVDAVVVRLEVVVGDRPVVAETVEALALEIVRPEAKRDAAPVIGAAAEHARAEPVESIAGRRCVRLTFERPSAPARHRIRRTAARESGRPRRGDWYGHAIIFESRAVSNITPASSISTLAPASVSTFAAMPPPAPEPTMTTSYTVRLRMICMIVMTARAS